MQQMRSGCNGRGVDGVVVSAPEGRAEPYKPPSCPCCKGVVAAAARTGVLLPPALMLALAFDRFYGFAMGGIDEAASKVSKFSLRDPENK